MIFIYSIKEKLFVDKALPNEKDPTASDDSGVHLIITQKYVQFFIPVLPSGLKQTRYFNINSGEEIPKNNWTPSMRTIADQSKSEIKGSWKLWMFLILLVAFFGFAIIYGTAAKGTYEKEQAMLEQRMETLQAEDVLFLHFYQDGIWQATAAKVTDVSNGVVMLSFSSERFPVEEFDFKAAAKKLSTSPDVFTSEEVEVSYNPLLEGRFVFSDPKSYSQVKVENVEVKSINRK